MSNCFHCCCTLGLSSTHRALGSGHKAALPVAPAPAGRDRRVPYAHLRSQATRYQTGALRDAGEGV